MTSELYLSIAGTVGKNMLFLRSLFRGPGTRSASLLSAVNTNSPRLVFPIGADVNAQDTPRPLLYGSAIRSVKMNTRVDVNKMRVEGYAGGDVNKTSSRDKVALNDRVACVSELRVVGADVNMPEGLGYAANLPQAESENNTVMGRPLIRSFGGDHEKQLRSLNLFSTSPWTGKTTGGHKKKVCLRDDDPFILDSLFISVMMSASCLEPVLMSSLEFGIYVASVTLTTSLYIINHCLWRK